MAAALLVAAAPLLGATLAPWAQAVDPPLEITVYAAASLKDALGALGPICAAQSGARPVYNFGASNDLARQILAAGKADIFFSADTVWMDEVAKSDMLEAASRRNLLSNRLVVVVPDDSTLQISAAADLASAAIKRLSLANPAAVPAGKYAKAWLEKAGVWDMVSDRVIPAPDVRAALAAVEEGVVQAGIVYRTDAAIARHARIAFVVPEADGPRITYPVAVLRDRPHADAARRMVDCYAGPGGKAQFERFGFVVLEGSPAAAPHTPSN